MEKVAQLGIDILLRLFKHHDVVRSEILEQITSRIVSRANSAMDFLKLLTTIIKDYPDTVEKYLSNVSTQSIGDRFFFYLINTFLSVLQIKDTLDFLSFLPLPTAERLLSAVQPISKTNESFRDGMILVLRKSLFAK
jgi:Fanconi anemia group I protein